LAPVKVEDDGSTITQSQIGTGSYNHPDHGSRVEPVRDRHHPLVADDNTGFEAQHTVHTVHRAVDNVRWRLP
jgi:hypothetical protein